MITAFRRYLDTWLARVLFGVLVVSFAAWGIGDMIRVFGTDTWAAKIGDRTIEPPELQEAYQRQLNQVVRMLGGRIDPSPEMKRGVLDQALDQLISQAALEQELRRLHIVVPEAELTRDLLAIPAFRGPDGKFNRQAFQSGLRNANLSEARFFELLRSDAAQRQLVEPLRGASLPPDALTRAVFQFQNETRAAGLVELPLAAVTPPEPGPAAIQRWYDNHPDRYSRPEYRRIKAVVLAPQTLASHIEISEDELRAAYDARRAEYFTPEKRSAEIIIVQDETKAKEFFALWRGGADWAAMQKLANDAGAAPVALTDATKPEFPDAALADAVFAAPEAMVSEPRHSALGWQVLRVTRIIPGTEKTLADVAEQIRAGIMAEKAADLIYQRATKVEDALASGTSLEELPADLGLGAAAGSLDAQGNTMDGMPAPIPGPAELRAALAAAAFQARPDDVPRLTEVPPAGNAGAPSYFAFTLEEITPSGLKPFPEVAEMVKEDVMQDAQRRAQEEVAAKLLTAVQTGQSLEDAATIAGVAYRRTDVTGRAEPAAGVPRELLAPLFALKLGEPTMLETSQTFLVAVAAEINRPDPKNDEAGTARTRDALARELGDDAAASLAVALRTRAQPRINQKMVDSFVQP